MGRSDIWLGISLILAVALTSAAYYILVEKAMACCKDDNRGVSQISALHNQSLVLADQNYALSMQLESVNSELFQLRKSLNMTAPEPSPVTRIGRQGVGVYDDKILLYIQGAFPVKIEPTGSMSPFINHNVLALETRPKDPSDLQVGDIIGYESQAFNTTIVHRIVEIGRDEEGWFAVTKGDANPEKDPGLVRFDDIKGVIVGLIY
jgi:hypothetical protein